MLYNTEITDNNGGNHAPHQTKKCWEWIDTCVEEYNSPRLYHIVFCAQKEFAEWRSYPMQKVILNYLMRCLRKKGIRASYHAAREIDDGANGKGEHTHVFICVESHKFNPCNLLNRKGHKHGGMLMNYCEKRGIKLYINPPQNPMHRKNNYMTLPMSKPEKIKDAKQWVSYLHKNRTKPKSGEIYSCSRSC